MKRWGAFKNGITIGNVGIENGIILWDEEFDEGCRITLEQCKGYCAITCGVYGAMVHTVFCEEKYSQNLYEVMKKELGRFMKMRTTMDEETEFYAYFCEKF